MTLAQTDNSSQWTARRGRPCIVGQTLRRSRDVNLLRGLGPNMRGPYTAEPRGRRDGEGFSGEGHVKRSQHLTFIALTVHKLHITIVLTDLPISCDFFFFLAVTLLETLQRVDPLSKISGGSGSQAPPTPVLTRMRRRRYLLAWVHGK